jgi:hypothetical protein
MSGYLTNRDLGRRRQGGVDGNGTYPEKIRQIRFLR